LGFQNTKLQRKRVAKKGGIFPRDVPLWLGEKGGNNWIKVPRKKVQYPPENERSLGVDWRTQTNNVWKRRKRNGKRETGDSSNKHCKH